MFECEQSSYGQSSPVNGQIREKGESEEAKTRAPRSFPIPSTPLTTLPFLFHEIDKRRFVSLGITDCDTAA